IYPTPPGNANHKIPDPARQRKPQTVTHTTKPPTQTTHNRQPTPENRHPNEPGQLEKQYTPFYAITN
ncbi:hypothetical protein, partial [Specibacter sp. RAF43]|uniref:hypothetical protein n=1 Tax=Specibacter sp. RAF43 TaxID=3233057 RepID=UPI003F952E5F